MNLTSLIATEPLAGGSDASREPATGSKSDQWYDASATRQDLGIAVTGQAEIAPIEADGLLRGVAGPEAASPNSIRSAFFGTLWRLVLLSFLTGLGVSLGLGAAVTVIASSGATGTGQTLEAPIASQGGVAMAQHENPPLSPRSLLGTPAIGLNQSNASPQYRTFPLRSSFARRSLTPENIF